jgi:RND superfamily putative drug exporter
MASHLATCAGRRAKWVILALWVLAVGGASAAHLPAKFSDAQENRSTTFLPADAESTKAEDYVQRLRGDQTPIVIVYRRAAGLTAADRDKIAAEQLRLDTSKLPRTSRFRGPQLSKDGTAALLRAQFKRGRTSDELVDVVTAVRDRVSDPGGGLEVKVTGDASFSADAIKVFQNINGTLLAASFLLVLVLLALIYRSPFFLWIPLAAVAMAEEATRSLGYAVTEIGVTVTGQSASILSILVLGAGTDYALLLVARYREELRRHEDRHEAMALALRTAGPAIVASGMTVTAALSCLTLAEVNGSSGLGPIGALGICVAVLAMLTLLPALLLIVGRRAFWPSVPRVGELGAGATRGRWRTIGERVARRPRRVAAGVAGALGVMSLGLLNFDDGLTRGNQFRDEVESVAGQDVLDRSFPGGSSAATEVVVLYPERVGEVGPVVSLSKVPGVASVKVDDRVTGFTVQGRPAGILLLEVVLEPEPFSHDAFALVPRVREAARQGGGPDTLVGGATAIEADLRKAAVRDNLLIVPLTLVVVFGILVALLRALVLPLLLMATVILSFAAALGVGAVVFDLIFGFPGSDPGLPLYTFIFLVALGIDYNIFLMARVREEARRHGTREGMLRGLAVTGAVITSAGIVLAGVFLVLGVLPLVFLTEIGFVVAFGVLLDTFVVRSLLVPALTFELESRIWWPARLGAAALPDAALRSATAPADSGPAPTG